MSPGTKEGVGRKEKEEDQKEEEQKEEEQERGGTRNRNRQRRNESGECLLVSFGVEEWSGGGCYCL
jgi:hypothetical protein